MSTESAVALIRAQSAQADRLLALLLESQARERDNIERIRTLIKTVKMQEQDIREMCARIRAYEAAR